MPKLDKETKFLKTTTLVLSHNWVGLLGSSSVGFACAHLWLHFPGQVDGWSREPWLLAGLPQFVSMWPLTPQQAGPAS